jgi:hypothetical protein
MLRDRVAPRPLIGERDQVAEIAQDPRQDGGIQFKAECDAMFENSVGDEQMTGQRAHHEDMARAIIDMDGERVT